MGQIGCLKTSVISYHYSLRNNLKMGPIRCLETSVINYHYSLHNNHKMGPIGCPETSVINYQYSLHNYPKMGPIGCPETSVRNYHYSLRNDPEERSSQLLRGGSLKSRQDGIHLYSQCLMSAPLPSKCGPTRREDIRNVRPCHCTDSSCEGWVEYRPRQAVISWTVP
jgi:hypothetical protein